MEGESVCSQSVFIGDFSLATAGGFSQGPDSGRRTKRAIVNLGENKVATSGFPGKHQVAPEVDLVDHDDPTVELTLVAPSSFVQALLRRMMSQRNGFSFTHEEQPGNGENETNGKKGSKASHVEMKQVTTDTFQGKPYLVGRFPLTPFLDSPGSDSPGGLAATEDQVPGEDGGAQAVGAELLHAILSVATGETTRATPQVIDEESPPVPLEEAHLSPREMEVLELLAQGATNRQVSAALSISGNTVKTHVRHIMSKLKTNNRTRTALLGRRLLQRS